MRRAISHVLPAVLRPTFAMLEGLILRASRVVSKLTLCEKRGLIPVAGLLHRNRSLARLAGTIRSCVRKGQPPAVWNPHGRYGAAGRWQWIRAEPGRQSWENRRFQIRWWSYCTWNRCQILKWRNGAMHCPNCGLINPESAGRCDCGYDFSRKTMETSSAEISEKRRAVEPPVCIGGGCSLSALLHSACLTSYC